MLEKDKNEDGTWPEIFGDVVEITESNYFFKIGKLTFFEPDRTAFPLLALAERTAQKGGILPCVMNAANEEAVAMFLKGKLSFTEISELVSEITENYQNKKDFTLSDVEEANILARELVKKKII